MKLRNVRQFALLLLLMTSSIAFAASVKIHVEVGRGSNSIRKGDTFYIIYKVSDTNSVPSTPSNVPGAKVLYFDRTGSSYSSSVVNGHASSTSTAEYTLTLRATQEGKFSFGPVSVGGARSNAVSYSIGAAGQQSSEPQHGTAAAAQNTGGPKFVGTGNGNLFLRASVSKTDAYENEALVYTVKLYCTFSAIRFVGATAAPKFEGFVIEESPATDKQLHFESYNGKNYATAVIARYIIFPQMKGSLKVLGNTYTVAVDERQYYNDPFYGSISTSTPVQLNVKPNDLVVNVKGLPQPQPADFSGGVGQFTLTSSLPTQKFLSNQASSIVYTVKGTGNLKYVKIPDLNAQYPKELEVYSPETDVKSSIGASNVSGEVRFDYSFMPLEEGKFTIPEVTLVYFNPSTGQYERSTAKGYQIEVGKGSASANSQSKSGLRFDDKLMPALDDLNENHVPYIRTFSYWLWFIIPVVLLVVALIVYRKHLKEISDLTALRSKKANKMARRRLRKAAACMKAGNYETFYDEILNAVWGYLGDKLKMQMSELSRDNISEKLADIEIDSSEILKVIDLLDECEFAKFSPVNQSKNMPLIYDKACATIESLEDSIDLKKSGVADSKPQTAAGLTIHSDVSDMYVNDQQSSDQSAGQPKVPESEESDEKGGLR
ncbi:MAG: protein BatD [Muribaculaceae bacterium]|nr:protein BatD [Muribaculaceae bacterium]